MDLEDAVRTLSKLIIEAKQNGGMSMDLMASTLEYLAYIHMRIIASQEGGIPNVRIHGDN